MEFAPVVDETKTKNPAFKRIYYMINFTVTGIQSLQEDSVFRFEIVLNYVQEAPVPIVFRGSKMPGELFVR